MLTNETKDRFLELCKIRYGTIKGHYYFNEAIYFAEKYEMVCDLIRTVTNPGLNNNVTVYPLLHELEQTVEFLNKEERRG